MEETPVRSVSPDKTCGNLRKSEQLKNLLEALMVRPMTCFYFSLLCSDWGFHSIPWHIHSSSIHSASRQVILSTFLLAASPTTVFTTLPPSSSLPHAGFLFPLIFSSTSSLALSALLGSTYNISLFSPALSLSLSLSLCLLFKFLPLLYFFLALDHVFLASSTRPFRFLTLDTSSFFLPLDASDPTSSLSEPPSPHQVQRGNG